MSVTKKPVQRHPAEREWVRAAVIAEMFDVSVSAVIHGDAGMDQIRSAQLSETAEKSARRWYLPDAVALKQRMLERATAMQQQMNAPLRFGRRREALARLKRKA